MMLSMLSMYEQTRNDNCFLCSNTLSDIKSYPNSCEHLFHYKCLRNYVDNRLEKKEPIICPLCNKIFHQIANKYKKSKEVLYQNVILSNDESQCCICFSKYKCPVATTDTCSHTFCFDCIKKWCTYKHECPMDRMPIKMLIICDFPGGHIIQKEAPPPIEQDLNGEGENDEILNTTCEICNLGNNDHLLLLCDNCNRGYHIYCLNAPLTEIPEGDWFCDECSDDLGVNNPRLPRGIRGLRRVIDDLQTRYESTNENRITRNITTRSRRRLGNVRESLTDSDWDDNANNSNSNRASIDSGQEGVRRSLRNRRRHSVEAEDEERLPALRSNASRQDEIIARNNVDNELVSRNRARVIEESEEESLNPPTGSNRRRLRNLNASRSSSRRSRITPTFVENESSNREEATVSGRNRQGSLSSEPESEIEPCKKKRKLVMESSSSDETSEDSIPSPSITRKRTRNALRQGVSDDDDCPLPRAAKKTRLLQESSDEDTNKNEKESDEEDESDSETTCSDSFDGSDVKDHSESTDETSSENDDEMGGETDRQRHISTSSSLSTIPCRITIKPPGPDREAMKLQSKKKIRQCAKASNIPSDSSNIDNTDSDYDPSTETIVRRQPSTSQRPSTSRKSKPKKRRSTRTTKKTTKRKTKRKKVSRKRVKSSTKRRKTKTAQESEPVGSMSILSIFGREKYLPVVSDEEMQIKRVARAPVAPETAHRPISASNNILSEITEAQSNLRQISLSTITRLPNGTVIHKSKPNAPAHSSTNENKDPTSAIVIPSTSTSQPTIPNRQSISTTAPAPLPVTSNESSSATAEWMCKIIKKVINQDEFRYQITKDESKTLIDRIIEKIVKRQNKQKTPGESSVKDFTKKYIEFFLKKRK